jgi:uncharacterized membrane protein YraQ (UPF0718 family)
MSMVTNIVFYSVAGILVILSLLKDKIKTKKAILKAWKSFENILPQLLAVVTLVGIVLALLDPETIGRWMGSSSGWLGVAIASLLGAITLIPGFIAFPTAALLVVNGAGYMQVGAFISSLMMVGVITFPLEKKFFGIKVALIRNILAFLFSFFVALVIGLAFGEI